MPAAPGSAACTPALSMDSLFPGNIILPIIWGIFAYVYVAYDAVRCAQQQQGPPPQRKAYNKWYVYALVLIASGMIGELVERPALRTMVQAFRISSGSMLPTLQIGDHILVDKLRYHFRPIARGDVIVYKYPQDESRSFLHRVVGLPGETLEIRGTEVLINGDTPDRTLRGIPRLARYTPWGARRLRPGCHSYGYALCPG